MSKQYNGIVFDMDGVLVDTEDFYYNRRKNFFEQYGLSIDCVSRASLVGADFRSIWQKVVAANDAVLPEKEEIFLKAYKEYKEKNPVPFAETVNEDAKRVLQYLKRNSYKIGLASSSAKSDILEMLETTSLKQYFDVIVSGEEFQESKPAPDIYQYTLKELDLLPNEAIAVEDSEKGIQSALSAGMTVWALVDSRYDLDQSKAHIMLEKLSDVCKRLNNMEK